MASRWRIILFVVVGLAAICAGTYGLATGDGSTDNWFRVTSGALALLLASRVHKGARSTVQGET